MAKDTITALPNEMIEYILEDKDIAIEDVIKFGLTCKYFHEIVKNSNELWRIKFFQRWPFLKKKYRRHLMLGNSVLHWLDETQCNINTRRKLIHQLSLMSKQNEDKNEKVFLDSDLKHIDPLFRPEEGAHPLAYYFLVDELVSILKHPETPDLKCRYALIVVKYLKEYHLREKWQRFMSLPAREQILEYGATVISQWCQPEEHISYSDISATLDKLAKEVRDLLRDEHPTHPLLLVPEEQLSFWKNNNIDNNQWDRLQNRQIMDALCKVFFIKNGFHGNSRMYYYIENTYIDQVLKNKHGIPITLAIVFESVARRLGIRCEAIHFPAHFLLRWKESYTGTESEENENFYIDVFNGGQLLTKKDCHRIDGVPSFPIEMYNIHAPATALEVVAHMAKNVEIAARQHTTSVHLRAVRLRSAFELQYMVKPKDKSTISLLYRFYLNHHIDATELLKVLQTMREHVANGRLR